MDNTLDKEVFRIIADSNRASDADVASSLDGEIISLDYGGRAVVIALVTGIRERKVQFKVLDHPFQSQTNFQGSAGVVSVYHFSGPVTYQFIDDSQAVEFSARRIYSSLPGKILLKNGRATEFSLSQQDSDLDFYLQEIKNTTEVINAVKDLETLNSIITQLVPFRKKSDNPNYCEEDLPLGAVIKKYGPLCRHQVGLAYLYSTLQGLEVEILGSARPVEHETHSFIKIFLGDNPFLLDPINNFAFPFSDSRQMIEKRGKTTDYHFPNQRYEFQLCY